MSDFDISMGIFNNREMAIGIWASLAFLFCLSKPSIRPALWGVRKALFHRRIVQHIGIMVAYIAVVIVILSRVGLWEFSQLKATIMWSLTVAVVTLFRINSISEEDDYFRRSILDNFKLVVALEFVIVFYTLSLWGELLLIPFTAFLGMIIAAGERNSEHAIVERFLNGVLVALGILMMVYVVYRLIGEPATFFSYATFQGFYLPPLLSTLFLPYVFAMVVYSSYERAFISISVKIKDPDLRVYSKRQAIWSFGVKRSLLKRWTQSLFVNSIQSKADIDRTISDLLGLLKREENPEEISLHDGWSPFLAAKFLKDEGLATGHYKKVIDGLDEWYASSECLELGTGILPNNIAFYVDGNERAATSLKLTLNMNDPETADTALSKLAAAARKLHRNSLGAAMPDDLEEKIINEIDFSRKCYTKEISLAKEDWLTERGYTLRFQISNQT